MPAAPLPTDSPRPRKPRRPRVQSEVFGSFTPWHNPAAVYGYGLAIAALTPGLGLVLGPIAVLLGLVGFIHRRFQPKVHGTNFAVAAMIVGTLNTLFNAAGLWCIGHGLKWW